MNVVVPLPRGPEYEIVGRTIVTHTRDVGSGEREFAEDLRRLSPGELRKKYAGEASCHANMKRRAKQGLCEIDPAWDQFRGFLADIGPRLIPDGSIERIDNSIRRYGPGLCRWATKAEQTRNRANTRWAVFNGERVTLGELAERLGTPYSTLHSALERGQTPEMLPTVSPQGTRTVACTRLLGRTTLKGKQLSNANMPCG